MVNDFVLEECLAWNLSSRDGSKKHLIRGEVSEPQLIVEAFRFRKFNYTAKGKYILATSSVNGINRDIDISWLKAASDSYDISPNINDYILVQVPLVTSDIPNRNLQAFAYEELTYFDPMYGNLVYKTFIGKPTHKEHDNIDCKKAKGVNFDSVLVPVPKYGIWKVMVLSGFDRTKDPDLARSILSGERNSYSMGALVDNLVCSICGKVVDPKNLCPHMKMGKGEVFNGRLIYELACGVNFIENSSVENPADVTAVSSSLYA